MGNTKSKRKQKKYQLRGIAKQRKLENEDYASARPSQILADTSGQEHGTSLESAQQDKLTRQKLLHTK